MLDSTEAPVIERGLQHIAGKPIINSVNLEEGDAEGTRLDSFLSLARDYGAAVVCTCIDTEGQARTAEWKVAGRPAPSTTWPSAVMACFPRTSFSTPSSCP